MPKAFIRWTLYLAAVLAVGPFVGALTAWLRAPDGGSDATPLVSTSPALGLAAAIAAVLAALIVGVIGARLVGAKAGMSAAGLVLAWAAWRTGTIDQIIRGNGTGDVLWRLAAEGVIFGVAGVALAFVVAALARADHEDKEAHAGAPARRLSPGAMAGPVIAGVIAGGAAAWLIAQTPLKGQAFAGAVVGAMFAAAAGRLIDMRAGLATLAIPVAVLAILGPLSGIVMGASPNMLVAGRNGALFPLANILPLDWIAGGLLGIPLGIGWAASLVEKRVEEKPAAR